MVYTAESRSLAALEVLVNLEGPARGYSIIRCEIPDDLVIEVLPESDLPDGWRGSPAPVALAALGDAWVQRAAAAVLKVPSVVVEGEHTFLLNPRHPSFERISIERAEPFPYDERLVKLTKRR